MLDGGRIVVLDEKPNVIESNVLGCGTYVFTPEIFDAIERTRPSTRSGKVELTDAIGTLATEGKLVFPLFLTSEYHNINSVEDYNYANYAYRDTFFDTFKIGLVIPAQNEEIRSRTSSGTISIRSMKSLSWTILPPTRRERSPKRPVRGSRR